MSISVDAINADEYDGQWQAALTPPPTISAGARVATTADGDARQWHDVTGAAARGGCTLEWDDSEIDDDGQVWDIYVAVSER